MSKLSMAANACVRFEASLSVLRLPVSSVAFTKTLSVDQSIHPSSRLEGAEISPPAPNFVKPPGFIWNVFVSIILATKAMSPSSGWMRVIVPVEAPVFSSFFSCPSHMKPSIIFSHPKLATISSTVAPPSRNMEIIHVLLLASALPRSARISGCASSSALCAVIAAVTSESRAIELGIFPSVTALAFRVPSGLRDVRR